MAKIIFWATAVMFVRIWHIGPTKYYAIYFEQPCHAIKFSPSGRLPLVCSADIIIIITITMVC